MRVAMLPFAEVQHARHVQVVLRHRCTPTAVLITIGQIEQMKMVQMAAGLADLNTSRPIGSQASGDTGFEQADQRRTCG
jgi:hypothetical protein